MEIDGAVNFYNHPRPVLERVLAERFGEPRFRAQQLFRWVYRRQVTDPMLMTDLSNKFRGDADRFRFPLPEMKSRQISSDGTRRYLFDLGGGSLIESVMIKQPKRMTLCVSSQVGCGMGCKFCRTATLGFRKNLAVADIIGQVLYVAADAKNFEDAISNIVFMGMGEPLHNFEGVTGAIEILTDPHGLNIGPRKITVSTVGLVPAIKRFSLSCPASLAVSLNATTNEVRDKIMPINRKYPIEVLLQTLREYPLHQKRKRITIEYVMLAGVNDTQADLDRLPKLLHGVPAKVNLIPYNENAGLNFKQPAKDWIWHWQTSLTRSGLSVTTRWSKGKDIDAACGQLAVQQ